MLDITTIGDVHLGRRFIEGVPLIRRGEREADVMQHFWGQMYDKLKVHRHVVQVGDLFDQFAVPNNILSECVEMIADVLRETKECNSKLYFMPGNHDYAKDTDKVSTFEIFRMIMWGHPRVEVVEQPMIIDGIGFMPWHPIMSAKEQAEQLVAVWRISGLPKLEAVITHCEIKSYGGDDFNLLPYETLAEITTDIYNGHIHTPSEDTQFGVRIHNVGSMEPYSHAEDPKAELYVTMTGAQYSQIHPELLEDKYVRVLLDQDEEVPQVIHNCMGFTIKRVSFSREIEEHEVKLDLSNFDSRTLLAQCLDDHQVGEFRKKLILEKFDAAFN